MNRREFLGAAASLCFGAAAPVPIIDSHIHLFDPTRPQGVPWPRKENTVLYRPALPARYRGIVELLGVVGAIEIEASPWLEDNQWVLEIAGKDSFIVGTVGNLDPNSPDFGAQLDRFRRNPLFRGIRYGNLWGRDLGRDLGGRNFISGLELLADADLALDTANPNPALIADVVRLTDRVPALRVVIDHLPQLEPPAEPEDRNPYLVNLRELSKRQQVFVKLSEVLRRVDGQVPDSLSFYRDRLDMLWELFGPNRVLYGSDWPNSDQWAPYPKVLQVVREYVIAKGPEAAEKYFWKNSVIAYRWNRRAASQPRTSLLLNAPRVA